MDYAVLVDLTKCIGCRGCQVACKRWNDLPGETTTHQSDWTNPPALSYDTYTHIRFNLDYDGSSSTKWHFLNWRCMHCKNPACLDACPVNAIVKTEEGAVVIKTETCIGCKFCVTACPFGIPQYNAQIEKVSKCHMCFDRIPEKEPACVQACPTDALVFDERSKIITMATEKKAKLTPGYIYGDVDNKPLGGTSFIYVSDVNVETLGVPKVGASDISAMVTPNAKLLLVPAVAGGLLYLAAWRKKRMEE